MVDHDKRITRANELLSKPDLSSDERDEGYEIASELLLEYRKIQREMAVSDGGPVGLLSEILALLAPLLIELIQKLLAKLFD